MDLEEENAIILYSLKNVLKYHATRHKTTPEERNSITTSIQNCALTPYDKGMFSESCRFTDIKGTRRQTSHRQAAEQIPIFQEHLYSYRTDVNFPESLFRISRTDIDFPGAPL